MFSLFVVFLISLIHFPVIVLRMSSILVIFWITAISDWLLVLMISVIGVFWLVFVMTHVRFSVIYNNFSGVIQVKVPVTLWQIWSCNPTSVIQINILACWDIIICLNFRQIIIFNMVITRWSPYWLTAYIYSECNLGTCCLTQKSSG